MQEEKYTANDILQILIDRYRFQSAFDAEVERGETLTFSTTIEEWRRICDLLEPNKLSEYYYKFFDLNNDLNELKNLLVNPLNTLQIFCDYIALHAIREKILPVYSLGKKCFEAAIFKKLIAELQKKGVPVSEIKPSSNLTTFFEKHTTDIMEVVSKLSPGTITDYKYEENALTRYSGLGIAISSLLLLGFWAFSNVPIFLWFTFIGSATLMIVGGRIKPKKMAIGNYNTFRDLIMGMKLRLE